MNLLYLLSLSYPIATLLGFYFASELGFIAYFFAPIVLFGIFPLLDIFFGKTTGSASQTNVHTNDSVDLNGVPLILSYLLAVAHFFMIFWGAFQLETISAIGYVGLTLSVGITTGALGITTAHELLHKNKLSQRVVGLAMMMFVCYMFFYTEHLKGHHKNVGTPEDPTTARRGENFYQYLWRSTIGIIFFLIETEKAGLQRKNKRFLRWDNPSLWYLILPFLLMAVLVAAIGFIALPYFIGQSLVAYILLELVSYIEHYGLMRKKLANGNYEKVANHHTWDADFMWSNYASLNLQHHAHHHAAPSLPYHLLISFRGKMSLPYGYPTMAIIACLPPLWHAIMDKRLEHNLSSNKTLPETI